LDASEAEYARAVGESRPDAVALGIAMAASLLDYTVGLDVQYDVVDDAEQENLLPEVVLDEDETDALSFPVDTARAIDGGESDV
jgi:hypothetical protein